MANTYQKIITKIFIQPVYDMDGTDMDDVVTKIEYIHKGTSENGMEATEGPFYYEPPKPTTEEGYIDFRSLTESQAMGWMPEDQNLDAIRSEIDRKIQEKEYPEFLIADLPWERPPYLPGDND